MHHKNFARVSGIIFLLIALLHLARLFYGWRAVIGGVAIPVWVSVVAIVVAGYLANQGLQLSKK